MTTRTIASDLRAVDAATTWRELFTAARAIWDWPVNSEERNRLCNRVSEVKERWSRRCGRVQAHEAALRQAKLMGRKRLPMRPSVSVPPPKIGSARYGVQAPTPPPPPAPSPPEAPPAAVVVRMRPGRSVVEQVKRAAAEHFGVSVARMEGPQRDLPAIRARHVAMLLMHDELLMSTVAIGRVLGGRDHSTVIHALAKVRSGSDAEVAAAVSVLRAWWQEEVGRVAQAV